MPKMTRESKMLQEVRRWRAEAYHSLRREPAATRLHRAQEWARRLNLPILGEDAEGGAGLDAPAPPLERQRDR